MSIVPLVCRSRKQILHVSHRSQSSSALAFLGASRFCWRASEQLLASGTSGGALRYLPALWCILAAR